MTDKQEFDVIIIGGSYAGLSAAMALGRSLRKVLIIDGGQPCNRQTPHSHNFLTHDGAKPAKIAKTAKEQVLAYDTVTYLSDFATSGSRTTTGFEIHTASNKKVTGKKLVFATGIKDIMPDIRGFAECWGISVIHCPYCHGYEYRSKTTGIMANGDKAAHIASLVRNLTDKVTIFTQGKADFTNEHLTKLNKNGISLVETEIAEIQHNGGKLNKILLKDGSIKPFDALYASIPFVQHTNIPTHLGCEITEQGYIKIDSFFKTTVKGVYACGDNSGMMRSIANAVYGGNLVGGMLNHELVQEHY